MAAATPSHQLSPLLVNGFPQHYPWGGTTFIPQLLHLANPANEPYAELWFGDHSRGPATAANSQGTTRSLTEWISLAPAELLGSDIALKYADQLPYLLKILDVKQMLSIQAHPSKEEAVRGFAAEEAAGIPIDASHRTFRDPNPKPEVMIAVTEFWLLHGFQEPSLSLALLKQRPALAPLATHLATGGLAAFYQYLMELPQAEVDQILQPLAAELLPLLKDDALPKTSPDYWAALACRDFRPSESGQYDRGIFSIYLMNLVHLQPGEGIFQGSGILHAYLEGVNVELMANSDNVFRGGLTNKHIDVPLLLEHIDLAPVVPQKLTGSGVRPWAHYSTPAEEFSISQVTLDPNESWEIPATPSPQIWLVLQGAVSTALLPSMVNAGQGMFVAWNQQVPLKAGPAGATLFRASVGRQQ
ncbi:MAG: mannose-6-phosphate isomerase, class I [Lewinellaceae bacterium]|nr:mannose-6-phosphate isomerase, class I [Lewinellaceae bacterium]